MARNPERKMGHLPSFLPIKELDKPDVPVKIFDMKSQYV